MKLRQKTCFITGAGSGIGRVVAMRFAHERSIVVALDRDAVSSHAVAAEIVADGGSAMGVVLDVTQEWEFDDAVDP